MVGTQTYHGSAERRPAAFPLVALVVLGAWVAGALAGAWAWWRPFRVTVAGGSMRPTFEPGDWLVATRRGRVRVGSIVVIEHPGRPGFELVKRVAHARDGASEPAPGELWVVGDDPDASTDSRAFGPIRRDAVRGVVRFRYGTGASGA